jgi:Tol biopolymer transport system component
MNANGTNKTQITSDSENKEFPAFSPDELSFAYTPYITGYFDSNIDVASFADPDNETQLTTNTNNTEFNGFWGNIQV